MRLAPRLVVAVLLLAAVVLPVGAPAGAQPATSAAVRHVTLSEQDDLVAYVEVAEDDRGVAIGREGRNIETARTLAKRHYDIDDIQLT